MQVRYRRTIQPRTTKLRASGARRTESHPRPDRAARPGSPPRGTAPALGYPVVDRRNPLQRGNASYASTVVIEMPFALPARCACGFGQFVLDSSTTMGRPELHSVNGILDGARRVVLDGGASAATIAAIASASSAPAGSIYHRFGTRDELLADLWIRAVKRSQAHFLAAIESSPEPLEAALARALSIFDFARAERDDARLLASLRREDLIRSPLPDPLTLRLRALNRPLGRAISRLAHQLYQSDSPTSKSLVALAVIDIPYGAVRRHLLAGAAPPDGLRPHLERAIRAALNVPPVQSGRPRRS